MGTDPALVVYLCTVGDGEVTDWVGSIGSVNSAGLVRSVGARGGCVVWGRDEGLRRG